MRRILAFALLFPFLMVLGCGGDDNPTAPAGPANVNGVWIGSVTYSGMSPASHPVSVLLNPNIGSSYNYTAAFTQSGESFALRLTSSQSGLFTDYVGTVGQQTFTANAVQSATAHVYGIVCGDGISRDIHLLTDTVSGTVSGNTITGTYGMTYNCVISGSNQADGVLTESGTFSFTRGK